MLPLRYSSRHLPTLFRVCSCLSIPRRFAVLVYVRPESFRIIGAVEVVAAQRPRPFEVRVGLLTALR
jgi:hypothetical protein